METNTTILDGISDAEKGAYLAAIASIATADNEASEQEMTHLSGLCEAANLSPAQQQRVLHAATSTDEQDLVESLNHLRNSDLRYSLVTDLFAFAKSDNNYSETEQQMVQKIASYLGVDQTQYGLLGEVAEHTNNPSLNTGSAGFLSSTGLGDKLRASGINGSSLMQGLISIAAPLILSRMMGGGRSGGSSMGGMLGSVLGGGGFGSGGSMMGGGGLGSLIGALSGGRGMGSTGGLLGRIFG